jgi:hypothetical protein
MNRNTNVGPVHGSRSPTTRQYSNEGSRGGKRPLDATVIRPFIRGLLSGVLLDLQHLVDWSCQVLLFQMLELQVLI